jgi:hypothetical protein
MTTKHTPGPWEVIHGTHCAYKISAGNFTFQQSVRIGTHPSVWNANAYLIAAAPDLLEALQAIVDADERGELCHDQIAQAVAALAKARGEA